MGKTRVKAKVSFHEQIASDIYSMRLQVGAMASEAVPGQFVAVYCKDGSRLLPRPISICEINEAKGELRLVYRVVGDGTEEFSKLHAGAVVTVMGPLGNGYDLLDKKAILIAGGIGIPPMLELAKQLAVVYGQGVGHTNLGFFARLAPSIIQVFFVNGFQFFYGADTRICRNFIPKRRDFCNFQRLQNASLQSRAALQNGTRDFAL